MKKLYTAIMLLALLMPVTAEHHNGKALLSTIITNNTSIFNHCSQVILVTNDLKTSYKAQLTVYTKDKNTWNVTIDTVHAVIGKKGFADIHKKREGDKKTPTGLFSLGTSFGYLKSINTKMPYRMTTENDFWIDDVRSEQYNQWVTGKPEGYSHEKLKRKDILYKYALVVNYNVNPVIKNLGSAIFIHVWRGPDKGTAGCVAVQESDIIKILAKLDPDKNPVVILGSEKDLLHLKNIQRGRNQ